MGGRGSSLPIEGDLRRFIDIFLYFSDFFPILHERSKFSRDSDGISKHFRQKKVLRSRGRYVRWGVRSLRIRKRPGAFFENHNFEKSWVFERG